MKREYSPEKPELLDLPQPLTPELERDLANLASLNRYFGSHQLVRRYLRRWLAEKRSYRVLDLATGYGDIPRLIAAWGAEKGITIELDAVDANAATVEIARKQSEAFPAINWICADALRYESAQSYDLVCCSLALHHFSETDAVSLLRSIRRLSHRFALVADLERTPLTTWGIWLLTTFIYRDPMTRYDGMLSAKRAFSFGEMEELAEQAGWDNYGHDRAFPCRQALWLEMRPVGDIPAPVLPETAALPCPT
jgi:ubiquinone/menaquinone biosynthesis C-methylase UbiE